MVRGRNASSSTRFEVAVFPLADAVLFPGVTLPIQITSESYLNMLRDVRSRGLPLAVSLVNEPNLTSDGSEEDESLQLNPICGAGKIQRARNLPDGLQEILIRGDRRVRLIKILQHEPYLIMEAESVEPENGGVGEIEFEEFQALIKTWAFLSPDFPDHLAPLFDEFDSLGHLSDFFVFHFLKSAPDKQMYLDMISPVRRAERLALYLQSEVVRMTRKLMKKRTATLLH
jgi:ATP-dependent Lon protease